jgi:hypothetical protein
MILFIPALRHPINGRRSSTSRFRKYSDSAYWNPSNDWSFQTVGKTSFDTAFNIPIYDNEVQIWGAEPGKAPISSVKKAAPPEESTPRYQSYGNG